MCIEGQSRLGEALGQFLSCIAVPEAGQWLSAAQAWSATDWKPLLPRKHLYFKANGCSIRGRTCRLEY